MFKKIAAIALIIFAAIFLTSCGGSASGNTGSQSLEGDWTMRDKGLGFSATVAGDKIEITMIAGDSEGLYWLGTFPNTNIKDETLIVSKGDTEVLERSLYGSSEATKNFTARKDEISFSFTMMGVTKTVNLKR